MSWLDTFKNDERSLYWLVEYIHHTELFTVNRFPTNIQEAREIIQCWENESINGVGVRLQFQLSLLMKSYFENILPIESFDWLSIKNPKQVCWVLFYINLNPISQIHFAPQNKYYRNFASNIKEAYPLIIKTFDAAMCNDGVKQNYLLAMKRSYSQYLTGKSLLPWLDIKDEETCSWVWRYLMEKVDEASGQKDTFQFIKPIDNETIYWSCISLIANWRFLKGRFVKNVEKPLFHHIEAIKPSNNTNVNSQTSKFFLSGSPLKYNYQIKFNAIDELIHTDINDLTITAPSTPLAAFNVVGNVTVRLYRQVTFTSIVEKLNQPSAYDCTQDINGKETLEVDLLPDQKDLTAYLYNANKQRSFRQKSNNSLGLTKANQKKLTNYAKEQKTTEKKALNEIVKTMLD
ncbi:hypothetical protein [Pseudoalteromonas sp. 1181_04]|uniref:hypothetical protein n=1 Tax=Pseudoalteromonas sp. 1181_04 TaxID=2604450 RepID=UPI00406341BC